MEERNIALVILGIIAIIAIVGLILLFTTGRTTTAQGVYGGAIKQEPYPYYTDRGRPAPDLPFPEVKTVDTTGKRDPENIYTVMRACPGGIAVDNNKAEGLAATGKWRCEKVATAEGGNCCYLLYPA